MAANTPTMTNRFLTRLTRSDVNISEIAFVSFVTRVTSLPTGIEFICSCESDSMCVNRSSRMTEMILCPTFCSTIACT